MQSRMAEKMAASLSEKLIDVYDRLFAHYGAQHWWPAETRWEMIVGAILTQSVAWANAETAIRQLRDSNLLEPDRLYAISTDHLAALIRASGYYNVKARKIKAFVTHVHDHYRFDLDLFFSKDLPVLRAELLSIFGVGPETADSIILYAAHKPSFVVDAYTGRLFARLGLAPDGADYETLRAFFEAELPRETS